MTEPKKRRARRRFSEEFKREGVDFFKVLIFLLNKCVPNWGVFVVIVSLGS